MSDSVSSTPLASGPAQKAPEASLAGPGGAPARLSQSGWTPGRVASLATGLVLGAIAAVILLAGVVTLTVDRAARDSAGFLTSGAVRLDTDGYALTSDTLDVRLGTGIGYPRAAFGDLRLRVTPTDPGVRLFVGMAPAADVARYLAGVRHAEVTDLGAGDVVYRTEAGSAAPADPTAAPFWSQRSVGTGTQTLTWTPSEGDWMIVVMRADGSPDVSVRADVGADVPVLTPIAIGIVVLGAGLLAGSAVLVVVPIARARRSRVG